MLVTRDLDFVVMGNAWAAEGREHAGIIYINSDHRDNTGAIVGRIMGWQESFPAEQMKNVVWWV